VSLVLERVSVRLDGRPVLRDVSLVVAAGEVVALEGASGAGKTTLVRVAGGLLAHTGRVRAAGTAVVFQQHALARRLSARTNVLVGTLARVGLWRAALGAWPRAEGAWAEECLARVGLSGLGPRRSDRLSGGQRQRVAIARALAQRAPVLLADEPVASLDPANAAAVLGLLRDLARREGLAVLLCLHQPELAARFADRRLHLADGKVRPC
jgi:phosphonate transport system ATP-binding protein